jgi:hypothetical protein
MKLFAGVYDDYETKKTPLKLKECSRALLLGAMLGRLREL